ncbi:hypothetical protein [Mycobacterium sp. SMC-4]|uniref:hypothetical protein n=1 Tax=Mycobacterium sp. SMC-4 TaxID=2857059 RepID=UPI003D027341
MVAAAVTALTLAGCGAQESSPQPTQATSAEGTAEESVEETADARSDEDQIREVVYEQARVFEAGAWDQLPGLTCASQREKASDAGEYLVPPMEAFGSREQMTAMTVPQVSQGLTQQFGADAPPELVDRVAQALVAYDEPAYKAGMLDLLKESATLKIDKVENIVVTGDTATAEVTSTRTMGGKPPQTRTDTMPFAREDGRWLDCTGSTGES